jgi:hypothetical protein
MLTKDRPNEPEDLDNLDKLEKSDGSDDSNELDVLDDLRIDRLDRKAPISNTRRSDSIEEIRERVAQSDRTIFVGHFNEKRRVTLQRNTIRLATFEIDNSQDLTDEQIIGIFRKKIRNGEFDHEISTLYKELYATYRH